MAGPPHPPAAPTADLALLDLFADVDEDVIARLVDGCDVVTLLPAEEIDIADTPASCCVVATGRLALFFEAEEARPRTVTLVEEGDVLVRPQANWTAVGPRLRCRAIDASTVVLVERDRLDAWMREPVVAQNLVRILSAQVADRELAVAIALEPRVERRILLKIRQLAERWGRVTPRGVRLDLRLTHQELADMVGAVRESVTIGLGNLARQDVISVRDRTIVIHHDDAEAAGD
jgi:CRP/FNR family transcriptional regulator, cyclic AMP receptor protein